MNIQTKRATWVAVLLLVMASVVMAQTAPPKAKATVSQESVKKYMQGLASDEMRGRGSATADELTAAKYIASQLKLLKIEPAGDDGGYLQTVKFGAGTTTNVIGILRGSDAKLTKETILLSAHLDHLGVGRAVNGDSIYNGADDDASGCTAMRVFAGTVAISLHKQYLLARPAPGLSEAHYPRPITPPKPRTTIPPCRYWLLCLVSWPRGELMRRNLLATLIALAWFAGAARSQTARPST